MPRSAPFGHTSHGRFVGYSLIKRQNDPTYTVYFRLPTGERRKRDTNQTGMDRAKQAAVAIIDEEYAPKVEAVRVVTWDEAVEKIEASAAADGLRGPSVDYYQKLIRRIRAFYSVTAGPADISEGMAEAWKKAFSSTPTRRKELPSQHTVFSLVRGYSALWQSWFVDKLGICPGNPWQSVEPPKTDKIEVKVIEDDTLTHFLGWLDQRFSGWQLPRLFLETKAVTGCRLADLCGIESAQLRDGRLHFKPEQTKGRKARNILLPPDLAAGLEAIKGKTYLWESQPAGLKEAVKKMGRPAHRIKPDFVPARFYYWVTTLFLDYGKANPDKPKIHSHQLRKRAFTAAWEAGVDPRKAAIAYGCNVDTVMKHYVNLDEQAVTDEVTGQLAAALTPKKATGKDTEQK
jgi:integrase